MTTLTIRRPDDWHLHLRDGDVLEGVLPHTSRDFARAIIMPNLVPPVVTTAQAAAYRDRILKALPKGDDFTPLMTLYLTETTDPADVEAGFRDGLITAVKLYPAGATTNSQSGVRDLAKVHSVLEKMAEIGLPLCVHGEVTDPAIDIFDREAVFLETVLASLRERLPELRVVLEHVTTENGVDYVKAQDKNVGATITTHHLMINRNAILAGGIRPHYYCLPVAKRESTPAARRRDFSDARFFLGTDSSTAYRSLEGIGLQGCAGIFTSINTMACLAEVSNRKRAGQAGGLRLAQRPAFYGLPANEATITLTRQDEAVVFPGRSRSGRRGDGVRSDDPDPLECG
ncbi:MAG: dihydroorotase [Alphaproteobacteria bacterium]|nr:dihydroorotase [Alphaproteobacteria bacterium]